MILDIQSTCTQNQGAIQTLSNDYQTTLLTLDPDSFVDA